MPCVIQFQLVSEQLSSGNVGDDWEYKVNAVVLNPGPVSAGEHPVAEHTLAPGAAKPLPGTMIALPAGDCGTGPRVKLTLSATEVDLFFDDHGKAEIIVPMECPGPGGPAFTREATLSAQVKESPIGGRATLTVKVRLSARCE